MRLLTSTLALLALASLGAAQVVQYDGGSDSAAVSDVAASYTAGNSFTYYDLQSQSEGVTLGGAAVHVMTSPWTAAFANGTASGNGEQGYALGSFADNGSEATFISILAANAQLSTSVTGAGPYYGVEGGSSAMAKSELGFTTTQATTLSVVGSMSDFGLTAVVEEVLLDITTNQQTVILAQGAGGFPINYAINLAAGNSYQLYDEINFQPAFQYDPTHNVSVVDTEGGSAYITATFTPTPAPEPLSCGLLGLGAVALLQRRKK